MAGMLLSIVCAKHSVKWQMRYSNQRRNRQSFTISTLLQHTFTLVLLVIIVMSADVYGEYLWFKFLDKILCVLNAGWCHSTSALNQNNAAR